MSAGFQPSTISSPSHVVPKPKQSSLPLHSLTFSQKSQNNQSYNTGFSPKNPSSRPHYLQTAFPPKEPTKKIQSDKRFNLANSTAHHANMYIPHEITALIQKQDNSHIPPLALSHQKNSLQKKNHFIHTSSGQQGQGSSSVAVYNVSEQDDEEDQGSREFKTHYNQSHELDDKTCFVNNNSNNVNNINLNNYTYNYINKNVHDNNNNSYDKSVIQINNNMNNGVMNSPLTANVVAFSNVLSSANNSTSKQIVTSKNTRTDSQQTLKTRLSQQNIPSTIPLANSVKKSQNLIHSSNSKLSHSKPLLKSNTPSSSAAQTQQHYPSNPNKEDTFMQTSHQQQLQGISSLVYKACNNKLDQNKILSQSGKNKMTMKSDNGHSKVQSQFQLLTPQNTTSDNTRVQITTNKMNVQNVAKQAERNKNPLNMHSGNNSIRGSSGSKIMMMSHGTGTVSSFNNASYVNLFSAGMSTNNSQSTTQKQNASLPNYQRKLNLKTEPSSETLNNVSDPSVLSFYPAMSHSNQTKQNCKMNNTNSTASPSTKNTYEQNNQQNGYSQLSWLNSNGRVQVDNSQQSDVRVSQLRTEEGLDDRDEEDEDDQDEEEEEEDDFDDDYEEENVLLSKKKIIELYEQQMGRKKVSILAKAMRDAENNDEEDEIQMQINEKFKLKEKTTTLSNRNCQVNLLYKKEWIHYEFETKDHTIEWLFNYLLRRLYFYEKNTLLNTDDVNVRQSIEQIVSFVSATSNMAVTYYFTQKKRSIDIFDKKCINIQPLYHDTHTTPDVRLPKYKEVGLEDFHLIRCIGLGGFSRVYLVQKKDTGKMYTLKLIDKKFIIENKKEIIVRNERNIMACIAHPFLLKLDYSFESTSYLGFTMEYCPGGELFYHLRRIKRMTEDMARFYFVEICLGIDYLHKRDIKPENILLDIDGHVRIGDFGLSKPDMDQNEYAHSFCGSPEYMAPEMLLKVTGLPPFYSHDTDEIYQRILHEELDFPDHVDLSSELRHLLRGLLTKNPSNRLGIKNGIRDILAHSWFQPIKIGDVLEKLIEPPLKPNILGFNFDQEEFSQGEQEFHKKLMNCQIGQDSEDLPQIFDEFYFDVHLNRLRKQRKLQLKQLKIAKEQHQNTLIKQQKAILSQQQQQQQQSHQQHQQQQYQQYQQQQQQQHQLQMKQQQMFSIQQQQQKPQKILQRKGSNSSNNVVTTSGRHTIGFNPSNSHFTKMDTEGSLPVQKVNPPPLHITRINTEMSSNYDAHSMYPRGHKPQNKQIIPQQLVLSQQATLQSNQTSNTSVNSKLTHMKQSNSVGQKQKTLNTIGKQHLKANSSIKLQANNFMNTFSLGSQQPLTLQTDKNNYLFNQQQQQQQQQQSLLHQQLQNLGGSQNNRTVKRMKTEEAGGQQHGQGGYYNDDTCEDYSPLYNSNRILTENNRRSHTLLKINTQKQQNPLKNTQQYSIHPQRSSQQNSHPQGGKQQNVSISSTASQGYNNSGQSTLNAQSFLQHHSQQRIALSQSSNEYLKDPQHQNAGTQHNGQNTSSSPYKNIMFGSASQTKHYNPLSFINHN